MVLLGVLLVFGTGFWLGIEFKNHGGPDGDDPQEVGP